MARLIIVLLVLVIGSIGCAAPQSTATPASGVEQGVRFDALAHLQAHHWMVAPDTVAVAVVDADIAWDLLTLGSLAKGASDAESIKTSPLAVDLRALYVERLNIDITRARAILVAVGPTRQVILIAGEFDKGDGEEVRIGSQTAYRMRFLDSEALPALGLQIPGVGVAIFPDEDTLQEALAAFAADVEGSKSRLDSSMPTFEALFSKVAGHRIVVAADIRQPMVRLAMSAVAPDYLADTLVVGLGRDNAQASIFIEGSESVLDAITTQVDTMRQEVLDELEEQRSTVADAELSVATGVLVAYHLSHQFAAQLSPTRQGNELAYQLELGSMTTISTLGILSALAIPAFVRYQERSREAMGRQDNMPF